MRFRTVAVDDSVFRRCGRRVHGADWQHDGSSPAVSKLSYGNCFVTAAILARLPAGSREVCLRRLARLHLPGKGAGPGKVETAAALASLLALAFPGRMIHVVADAAYHGPALRALPQNLTWTCRIPRSAVLYDLPPPAAAAAPAPRVPGWARPMTSPPRRPGTPSPSPPTAASTASTSPPSPAGGTGHGTPGPCA